MTVAAAPKTGTTDGTLTSANSPGGHAWMEINGRRFVRTQQRTDSRTRLPFWVIRVLPELDDRGRVTESEMTFMADYGDQFAALGGFANATQSILPSDALDAEIEALKDAGFATMAARLEAEKTPATNPFAGAKIPIEPAFVVTPGVGRILGMGTVQIRPYLDRFAAGDLGIVGKLGTVTLTAQQRWCPQYFGQPVQNAVAVESGSGLVKAVYKPFVSPASRENRPNVNPDDELRLTALLVPGQPIRMLVHSSRG